MSYQLELTNLILVNMEYMGRNEITGFSNNVLNFDKLIFLQFFLHRKGLENNVPHILF